MVGDPEGVVSKVFPALNDPAEAVRLAATTTLGFFPIRPAPSLPKLLKAAVDEKPSPNSRGRGIMANLFQKIRPLKPSLPFLMESIGSDNPKIRSYAIMALGQMSSRRAFQPNRLIQKGASR